MNSFEAGHAQHSCQGDRAQGSIPFLDAIFQAVFPRTVPWRLSAVSSSKSGWTITTTAALNTARRDWLNRNGSKWASL